MLVCKALAVIMESILLYILLAVLSLGSCVAGFHSEVLNGNIRHLENGREPNAGAAIFPTIPLIPIVHFGLVYGLNQITNSLGWYVIFAYFGVIAIYHLVTIPKLNRVFRRLNAQRNHS